jgi:hypothetical protein
MSPIKMLALPGGFRIYVRGWPALFALLALIAIPMAARSYRTRPAPPLTVTLRDLQQMGAQYQARVGDTIHFSFPHASLKGKRITAFEVLVNGNKVENPEMKMTSGMGGEHGQFRVPGDYPRHVSVRDYAAHGRTTW